MLMNRGDSGNLHRTLSNVSHTGITPAYYTIKELDAYS